VLVRVDNYGRPINGAKEILQPQIVLVVAMLALVEAKEHGNYGQIGLKRRIADLNAIRYVWIEAERFGRMTSD
jgi:hypothetical protein